MKGFLFRTKVREAARKGPNFAGHYTIATWGCGSDCEAFAVVDAISGQLYYPVPFDALDCPPSGKVGGGTYGGLGFRLDSSLLIADGCPLYGRRKGPIDERCGARYYNWTDHEFHLLRTIAEPLAELSGSTPGERPSKP